MPLMIFELRKFNRMRSYNGLSSIRNTPFALSDEEKQALSKANDNKPLTNGLLTVNLCEQLVMDQPVEGLTLSPEVKRKWLSVLLPKANTQLATAIRADLNNEEDQRYYGSTSATFARWKASSRYLPSWGKTIASGLFTLLMLMIALLSLAALAEMGILGSIFTGFMLGKLALTIVTMAMSTLSLTSVPFLAAIVTNPILFLFITASIAGLLTCLLLREWLIPGDSWRLIPFDHPAVIQPNQSTFFNLLLRRFPLIALFKDASTLRDFFVNLLNPAYWIISSVHYVKGLLFWLIDAPGLISMRLKNLWLLRLLKGIIQGIAELVLTPVRLISDTLQYSLYAIFFLLKKVFYEGSITLYRHLFSTEAEKEKIAGEESQRLQEPQDRKISKEGLKSENQETLEQEIKEQLMQIEAAIECINQELNDLTESKDDAEKHTVVDLPMSPADTDRYLKDGSHAIAKQREINERRILAKNEKNKLLGKVTLLQKTVSAQYSASHTKCLEFMEQKEKEQKEREMKEQLRIAEQAKKENVFKAKEEFWGNINVGLEAFVQTARNLAGEPLTPLPTLCLKQLVVPRPANQGKGKGEMVQPADAYSCSQRLETA